MKAAAGVTADAPRHFEDQAGQGLPARFFPEHIEKVNAEGFCDGHDLKIKDRPFLAFNAAQCRPVQIQAPSRQSPRKVFQRHFGMYPFTDGAQLRTDQVPRLRMTCSRKAQREIFSLELTKGLRPKSEPFSLGLFFVKEMSATDSPPSSRN